jgi:hypothetical protein
MFTTPEDAASVDPAPGLSPWGPVGNTIAKLVKSYPPLALRVLFAPPGAFHSYVIAVQRWDASGGVEKFAKYLHETDPKELVRSSFRVPAPALFRILKRTGKHAHPKEFYDRLNDLLLYHSVADEIARVINVTPAVVDFFYLASAKPLDPLVLAAHRQLEYRYSRALAFHDVLQVCRQYNIIPNEQAATTIIRQSDEGRVHEIIGKWFERSTCPTVLEGLPPQLTQITNGKEMNAVARRYKNCLIDLKYKIQLVSGQRIFLTFQEGKIEAVASLVVEPGQPLWIDECNLINRRIAGRLLRERISKLLTKAGYETGARSFQQAWDVFVCGERMPNIEDIWDQTWANQN